MQETEIKLKYNVEEKEKLINYCETHDFIKKGNVVEKDVYYSPSHRDFIKEDRAVRVRFETLAAQSLTQCKFTYKGPNAAEHMHSREELEVTVSDGEVLSRMLDRLDFLPVVSVIKKRIYYVKGNLTICLDHVNTLGEYFELELLNDTEQADSQDIITHLLHDLALSTAKFEPRTYLELILQTMGKR